MNKAWLISDYPHFDPLTCHANIISPRLLCRSCMFPRESNDFRATGSSLTSSYYMLRSYFRAARESHSHTRKGTRHHPVLQWDLSTLEILTWRLARILFLFPSFLSFSLCTVDVIKNMLLCAIENILFRPSLEYIHKIKNKFVFLNILVLNIFFCNSLFCIFSLFQLQ